MRLKRDWAPFLIFAWFPITFASWRTFGVATGASLFLALHVAMAVFVAVDAAARRVPQPRAWALLVGVLNLPAFLAYSVLRPRGPLVICSRCARASLRIAAECPYCVSGETV